MIEGDIVEMSLSFFLCGSDAWYVFFCLYLLDCKMLMIDDEWK